MRVNEWEYICGSDAVQRVRSGLLTTDTVYAH